MILQNKITVFGATGKVGKELIKFLSSAEVPTIAVTRNKSKTLEMPFVEWQQADLSEKNSLNKCLKNSTAVFLSSGFSRDFVKEQQNAVVAAKQAGVSHILRLSSAVTDEISTNSIARL
jgi:NAD(P)H dehydrogenase (quinone)